MNIWDILILCAVGAAVVVAVRTLRGKGKQGGCSCGCGGQKSNKAVIILWVVVLIGIAVFGVYSRMNADPYRSEADKILKHAYTLYEQEKFEESADCLRQAAERLP